MEFSLSSASVSWTVRASRPAPAPSFLSSSIGWAVRASRSASAPSPVLSSTTVHLSRHHCKGTVYVKGGVQPHPRDNGKGSSQPRAH